MSRGRMRWDCSPDRDGCYRRLGQPDLTVLDECFPGRIGMTDVDGLVEIDGQFLFIEWKRRGDVPAGQRIMFERLTRHPEFTVLVILGDPATMAVERYDVFKDGGARAGAAATCPSSSATSAPGPIARHAPPRSRDEAPVAS